MVNEEHVLLFVVQEYTSHFLERLEDQRARRGIPKTAWAQHMYCTDQRGSRCDLRQNPYHCDFPISVYLENIGQLQRQWNVQQGSLGDGGASVIGEASSIPNAESHTVISALQAQPSESVNVVFGLIRVGRSPKLFRNALRQLGDVFVELTRSDGMPGAKLVCRRENRESIETYLTHIGAMVEGKHQRLDDLRPRHLIVQEDFQEQVDSLLDSFPRVGPERIAPISHLSSHEVPGRGGRDTADSIQNSLVTVNVDSQVIRKNGEGQETHPICNVASSQTVLRSHSNSSTEFSLSNSSQDSRYSPYPTQSISIPSPVILSDDEKNEDSATSTLLQTDPRARDLNHIRTHPLIYDKVGFVLIPTRLVSEGQQTASTGARINVNPRGARASGELGNSQSLVSTPSQTYGPTPSTIGSLSLGRRLHLSSQQ